MCAKYFHKLVSDMIYDLPYILPNIMIRDVPIIGINQLVRWYRLIAIYTVGTYKILFLLPKVNKYDSSFHFR